MWGGWLSLKKLKEDLIGGVPFRLDVREEKGVKDDSEVFYLCNQQNGAAISRDGGDWGWDHFGGALRDLENLRNLNGDTGEVVQCVRLEFGVES